MKPADYLDGLSEQIDAFFDRVSDRYGDRMQCGRGCADCCKPGLTVTAVEAERIERYLEAMAAGRRAGIAERARSPAAGHCAALAEDRSCSIYPVRPLVCRSHGVPIVLDEPATDGRVALPVLDCCPLNFTEPGALEDADEDCRLIQSNLATRLLAIDSAHSDELGEPRGRRLELADLLTAG